MHGWISTRSVVVSTLRDTVPLTCFATSHRSESVVVVAKQAITLIDPGFWVWTALNECNGDFAPVTI